MVRDGARRVREKTTTHEQRKYNPIKYKAMKTINTNTKRAQAYIYAYKRSSIGDIYEAYKNPSTRKTRAFYGCTMIMENENGHGCKIIGYNSDQFTAAWIVGNSLRIETACNSFVIPNAI